MNNIEGLKKCILSIHSQTFQNYEVWIIDCNSKDDTVNFLKTLEKPFYWLSDSDNGIYDAMNKGILKAKGEWIYFLGCDDKLYAKDTLMKVSLNLDNSIDIFLGQIKYDFNTNDSVAIKRNDGIFKSSWSNYMWIKNTVHHQSVFYNKEIFKNISYSLKYKILSDYYLNLKLQLKGVSVKSMNLIVALCGTKGVSKNYGLNLYKEEVDLKTKLSTIVFKPIFIIISTVKYIFKKCF